jgi:mono/diheme cytochrome c family protein
MNDQHNFDDTDIDSLHAAVKREKIVPQPGHEPAPVWVFIGTMIVMILGGGYAGAFMGNISNKPEDPRIGGPGEAAQLDPFQTAMKHGATIFNNCAGCHQATGVGQPGLIPPLAGSDWVLGGTERTARIAMFGLAGPVTVKGAAFNNVMVPPVMSDGEIADVLTYVRNSWGNSAPMVTKEMVKKVRAAVGAHAGPWQPADLQPFADKNIPGEIPAGPGATAPAAAPPGAPPAAAASGAPPAAGPPGEAKK